MKAIPCENHSRCSLRFLALIFNEIVMSYVSLVIGIGRISNEINGESTVGNKKNNNKKKYISARPTTVSTCAESRIHPGKISKSRSSHFLVPDRKTRRAHEV